MLFRARGTGSAPLLVILLTLLTPTTGLSQEDSGTDAVWIEGPFRAQLGRIAEIDVPDDYVFLDGEHTIELLEASGNVTSGDEVGAVAPAAQDEGWFLIFEYAKIGYVPDDEKDELDADAILASLREGNKQANAVRQERGFPTMRLVGWEVPPHYNDVTHNLEWCIRGESEGEPVLNHNTRLLGRNGVMSVTLVVDPEEYAAVLPASSGLLEGYSFSSGHRYAEFRKGDRVAEVGLTALIAGGAGALAAKAGLFKKFGKLLVIAVVAVVGFFRRLFRRLFGAAEEPTRRSMG